MKRIITRPKSNIKQAINQIEQNHQQAIQQLQHTFSQEKRKLTVEYENATKQVKAALTEVDNYRGEVFGRKARNSSIANHFI